eukprot:RCo039805
MSFRKCAFAKRAFRLRHFFSTRSTDVKSWCFVEGWGKGKAAASIENSPQKCGEDSFFISPFLMPYYLQGVLWFGVADGVGGWRENGVDPGQISRKLMSNASEILEQKYHAYRHTQTLLLLAESYWKVKYGKEVEAGSTTACIAKITPRATRETPAEAWTMPHRPPGTSGWVLEVANMGDSGMMVFGRPDPNSGKKAERLTLKWTTPFQRRGYVPNQLGIIPKHLVGQLSPGDPVQANVSQFLLSQGDVLVMATDGVWDNMNEKALEEIVNSCCQTEGSSQVMHPSGLQALCKAVVQESLKGPKPDDITVVSCVVGDGL